MNIKREASGCDQIPVSREELNREIEKVKDRITRVLIPSLGVSALGLLVSLATSTYNHYEGRQRHVDDLRASIQSNLQAYGQIENNGNYILD